MDQALANSGGVAPAMREAKLCVQEAPTEAWDRTYQCTGLGAPTAPYMYTTMRNPGSANEMVCLLADLLGRGDIPIFLTGLPKLLSFMGHFLW